MKVLDKEMIYNPRRPLRLTEPFGYLESDKDYVDNNFALAVRLLDKYGWKYENKRG